MQVRENIFSFFFDIMVHLPIHLVDEARIAGPMQYRWMYPIDKYGFFLINSSCKMRTNEPCVLTSQSQQVYYVKDTKDPNWLVVEKTKPRDLYDVPEKTTPRFVKKMMILARFLLHLMSYIMIEDCLWIGMI